MRLRCHALGFGLVLGFVQDGEQLYLEDKRCVRSDTTTVAPLTIGEVGGNEDLPLGTDRHQLESLGPAFDNSRYRQGRRLVALIGAVDLCPVEESAPVVANDLVIERR